MSATATEAEVNDSVAISDTPQGEVGTGDTKVRRVLIGATNVPFIFIPMYTASRFFGIDVEMRLRVRRNQEVSAGVASFLESGLLARNPKDDVKKID